MSADEYLAATDDYAQVGSQVLPSDVDALEAARQAFRQDFAVTLLLAGDSVRERAVDLQVVIQERHVDVVSAPQDGEIASEETRTEVGEAVDRLIVAARDELN